MLKVDSPILDFTLQSVDAGGMGEVTRESLLGQWTILFVYPKDDTYG